MKTVDEMMAEQAELAEQALRERYRWAREILEKAEAHAMDPVDRYRRDEIRQRLSNFDQNTCSDMRPAGIACNRCKFELIRTGTMNFDGRGTHRHVCAACGSTYYF